MALQQPLTTTWKPATHQPGENVFRANWKKSTLGSSTSEIMCCSSFVFSCPVQLPSLRSLKRCPCLISPACSRAKLAVTSAKAMACRSMVTWSSALSESSASCLMIQCQLPQSRVKQTSWPPAFSAEPPSERCACSSQLLARPFCGSPPPSPGVFEACVSVQ